MIKEREPEWINKKNRINVYLDPGAGNRGTKPGPPLRKEKDGEVYHTTKKK